MPLGVRGANPIWSEFDLVGNLFDDSYYMFVLENTIPYIPATVYHDPNLNVAWTNPIQFLANGTLPNDIYFESDVVYRLEFRQGATQADPLIYEVNNYIAGTGGSSPVDSVAFATSNQITNPQFSLVSFTSPLTISATDPDPIEIAPGWFLELAGTGTATITKLALTNTNENPSNAPYALQFQLNGWNAGEVFLRQRFQQNGMLWANKTVSSSVTALLDGSPQEIGASLIDSNNTLLAVVLPDTAVNEAWNEFTGYGEIGDTTNPDLPPAAYIDYKLAIPSNIDISITSIQLIAQDLPLQPLFEQDSIERQIDHTFNYYKPKLEYKQIPSLLTAWDFPLNPGQFFVAGNITTTADYMTDQTIAVTAGGNVAVARDSVTNGFKFTTAGATYAFALLQYLSGAKAKKILGAPLSVNINAYKTAVGSDVTARVYMYRAAAAASFPDITSNVIVGSLATTGVFTLTGGNGFTEISKVNNDSNSGTLSVVSTNDEINDVEDINISGWQVTDATQISDTDKFAIVVTFAAPTISTVITVNSIGLMSGNIATRPAPQTKDEVLAECEYYYETSYELGTAVATATTDSALSFYQIAEVSGGNANVYATNFSFNFKNYKLAIPTMTFWSTAGTAANLSAKSYSNAGASALTDAAITNWGQSVGSNTVSFEAGTNTVLATTAATNISRGAVYFHYRADTRLGTF